MEYQSGVWSMSGVGNKTTRALPWQPLQFTLAVSNCREFCQGSAFIAINLGKNIAMVIIS